MYLTKEMFLRLALEGSEKVIRTHFGKAFVSSQHDIVSVWGKEALTKIGYFQDDVNLGGVNGLINCELLYDLGLNILQLKDAVLQLKGKIV